PDGRVQMALDINKDTPNTQIATGAGVAIDTKHVKTDVLVENGGTVVIGGIYTQEERRTQTRVPFLGDLPYVGFLFRNTETRDNRAELLIFVTPRIVSDNLTLR
ncbi:type IV pilus secretin PilQ, partial [Enterobacter hormaechei]|nr:type IV pilus secretin PilQ [Enterobacter hormaechei]